MTFTHDGPRSHITRFVRGYPVAVFVLLAYALSWWPWIWFQIDPVSVDSPMLPFGPLLAAFAVLAMTGGWQSVNSLLARCFRWRIGPIWYAIALMLPLITALVAVELNLLSGASRVEAFSYPSLSELAARFLFIFILIGMGEEIAWRGFLLERLLARRTVLVATFMVALIHLVWHAPLFGVEYHYSNILPWAIAVICFSVVISWIYVRTGGSLLPAILGHTAVNTSGFLFGMFEAEDLVRMWWLWSFLWVLAAIAVFQFAGKRFWQTKTIVR